VPIASLTVGVPKESHEGEKRVAITPKNVEQLKKAGFSIVVEKGAGVAAKITDQEYEDAGATIVDNMTALGADLVLKVVVPFLLHSLLGSCPRRT
jgi:NAD(P) transhydrogenase subunit alpha